MKRPTPHEEFTQCASVNCKNHYPHKARCKHYVDGEQVPCPPMCPYQSWPQSLFRRKFWSRKWVLR